MGSRRRLLYFAASIIFVLVSTYLLYQISKSRTFQFFGEIIPRVETKSKYVALTFDDGPVPGATEEILDILGKSGVRATFFLIGAELEQNPEAGRKIAAAGHEIGNHTYSHDRMVFKTPAFIASEIERTDDLIRKTGYRGEINFRAPFCKKLALLPFYLSKHNRKMITWDIEPDSFPEIAGDSNKIIDHVIRSSKPGSIILLHAMYPSRRESLKSIEGIIAGLKQNGYEFKTVSELISSAE